MRSVTLCRHPIKRTQSPARPVAHATYAVEHGRGCDKPDSAGSVPDSVHGGKWRSGLERSRLAITHTELVTEAGLTITVTRTYRNAFQVREA
jgi:hypothetical protein